MICIDNCGTFVPEILLPYILTHECSYHSSLMETVGITEVSLINVVYTFKCNPLYLLLTGKKVLFVINLLTEEALAWASPYVEKDDVILDNFNSFVAALNQVCDDPNRCPTAEAKLHNLWQGRRSVAEYTTEFRHWISDTN